MDELDRLYRRLVQNVRGSFPELLAKPFELSQIYQQLVPYRTNRRELGFDSNDQYELALCQLVSGVRGYLIGDAEMQATLRRELESPNPDLDAYRVYATASLRFAPEPLRELPRRATPQSAVDDPGNSWPPIATPEPIAKAEQATAAARATETAAPSVAPTRHTVSIPPLTRPMAAAPERASSTAATPPIPPRPIPPSAIRPPQPLESSMPPGRPNPLRATHGQACRYCASALPEDRAVVYCPTCGHNLTVQHCPACNTELDVGWKFCITCGRDVAGSL